MRFPEPPEQEYVVTKFHISSYVELGIFSWNRRQALIAICLLVFILTLTIWICGGKTVFVFFILLNVSLRWSVPTQWRRGTQEESVLPPQTMFFCSQSKTQGNKVRLKFTARAPCNLIFILFSQGCEKWLSCPKSFTRLNDFKYVMLVCQSIWVIISFQSRLIIFVLCYSTASAATQNRYSDLMFLRCWQH